MTMKLSDTIKAQYFTGGRMREFLNSAEKAGIHVPSARLYVSAEYESSGDKYRDVSIESVDESYEGDEL